MDKSLAIKKFKEVEKKLLKMLKNSAIEFSENDSEEIVKQNIKKHIEVLKDVKALFDEYEMLAKKIQSYDDGDDSQMALLVSEESAQMVQKGEKKSKLEKIPSKNATKTKDFNKKDVDLSTNFSKQA